MALITDCMRYGKFIWTEEADEAFGVIKTKLTTSLVLVLPDFSLNFKLHCDASKLGIRDVLSQHRPVAYYYENLLEHVAVTVLMMSSSMLSSQPLSTGNTTCVIEILCCSRTMML